MIRALNAEALKYRRTPALLLAVGVPALLTLAGFLIVRFGHLPASAVARSEVLAGVMLGLWTALALPMGVAILSAQAVGLEDTHLKQILVQPVRRAEVYGAKLVAVALLVALGSAVLVGGFALVGALNGLLTPVALAKFASTVGLALAASLPLVALGVGSAFRFRWPVTLGSALVGSAFGSYALQASAVWKFLPWSYPLAVAGGLPQPFQPAVWTAVAVAAAGLVLVGLLSFSRQEPR